MVNKKQSKPRKHIRINRYFSEEIRREVVNKIERTELSVTQASREYEVSLASIYKWIYRYSIHLKKGNRLIVEKKSQTERFEQMQQRIAELERALGQKQLEIDILNKVLEIGSQEVGFDIKKKYNGKSSTGIVVKKGSSLSGGSS